MRQLAFISVIFLLAFQGLAQDYTGDFEKINKVYTNGINMDFSYSYYDFHSDPKPQQTVTGKIKQTGSLYHIVMGKVEIINGKWFKVIADHQGKTLTFDSSDKKSSKDYFDKLPVSQLMANYSKIEFSDKGATMTYRIFSKDGPTVYSDLTVLKNTFIIQSIVIYFKDTRDDFRNGAVRNKLVVNYWNVTTGVSPPESEFSIDKYIVKNNNRYSLQIAYKKYEFVNMISK